MFTVKDWMFLSLSRADLAGLRPAALAFERNMERDNEYPIFAIRADNAKNPEEVVAEFAKQLRTKLTTIKERGAGVVVLGDRYETLCVVALLKQHGIRVAQIAAGDTPIGPDYVMPDHMYRDAISRLADILFTSYADGLINLSWLGKSGKAVHHTGLPSVDADVVKPLGVNPEDKAGAVVTFHPVPGDYEQELLYMEWALQALLQLRATPVWISYPGPDYGSAEYQHTIQRYVQLAQDQQLDWHATETIHEFHERCEKAKLLVGNSSAFLIEMAELRTNVALIGRRQEGRPVPMHVLALPQVGDAAGMEAFIRYAWNETPPPKQKSLWASSIEGVTAGQHIADRLFNYIKRD